MLKFKMILSLLIISIPFSFGVYAVSTGQRIGRVYARVYEFVFNIDFHSPEDNAPHDDKNIPGYVNNEPPYFRGERELDERIRKREAQDYNRQIEAMHDVLDTMDSIDEDMRKYNIYRD